MRCLLRLTALLGLVLATTAQAAYLTDVPVTLEQPNGAALSLLSSGDEFYNWVHDDQGYVIVRHPETGWLVYAARRNGNIVPTEIVVGAADPAAAGLEPNIRPDASVVEARRSARMAPAMAADGAQPAPRNGTLNNIVVFIRFADDPEFTTQRYIYNNIFNSTSGNSLYTYFREASYNKLFIESSFYPQTTGGTVISYQDTMPRNYYKVYNAATNPEGYKDGQTAAREHGLLSRAVAHVRSQVPSNLNLDIDGDARVDSIAFIVKGDTEGWSELLWPHAWSLYTQDVRINNVRIGNYSFQIENSTLSSGVGVLAHETGHTLGMPDLYRYKNDEPNDPIGAWDVMAANRNPPQHMSAYMKFHYMKWIAAIPEITQTGVYTLNPLTSETNNCYKIRSPNSSTEYFVLEYRRKIGTFEGSVPNSGLVIYRVNDARRGSGNSQGPPDEIYVYRRGGTMTSDGSISLANFSANALRTAFNDTTNPSAFLSNGLPSGLSISNVGAVGDTISFTVTIGPTMRFATIYGEPRDGEPFPFSVRVGLMDVNNRLIPDATDAVTLQLEPGSGATGANLSGATTVNAVNGMATFEDLRIDTPGTGYKLVATANGLKPITSGAFNVAPFTFNFLDAIQSLRWASGFDAMPSDKMPRWDVTTEGDSAGRIDLADVSSLLLKSYGLLPNP